MFENISENDSSFEIVKLLNRIIDLLSEITEFSKSELKAISILESDKYLSRLLTFYKKNKKHVKRKHSKELLQALTEIAKAMNPNNQTNERGFRK